MMNVLCLASILISLLDLFANTLKSGFWGFGVLGFWGEQQKITDWEEKAIPIYEEYIHHPVHYRGNSLIITHLGTILILNFRQTVLL
jgi:hypothetical protein